MSSWKNQWDKAAGVTEVPANAAKCLDGNNLKQVYEYVTDYWKGKKYPLGMACRYRSLCTKKGDLSDLNKWKGINLMDICSKIFSYIVNERLYALLKKDGVKT